MIKIYAYGEDALTLWALKEPLGQILKNLEDESDPDECIAFFRPSFGRRGGDRSVQFGEFDLILITQDRVILAGS